MENDLYNLNAIDPTTTAAPNDYRLPSNAIYYNSSSQSPDQSILPIDHIILNNHIEYVLRQLKKTFGSSNYNQKSITSQTIKKLNPNLKTLFDCFRMKKPVKPIQVRASVVVGRPNPYDPSYQNIAGFGTALINIYPTINDTLYTMINGSDQLALSIYFGYNHIPAIVQF
jgi:hypothetical protein